MPNETELVPIQGSEKEEMLKAFDEIQMPKTPFELETFVVGAHHTVEQQYAHCVLELSLAYDDLRIAKLEMDKAHLEIQGIDVTTPIGVINAQIKGIQQEQLRRAMLGKIREFEVLYRLWRSFPKQYTRDDLNAAAKDEYTRRLEIQAQHDLNASGVVSVSNQEGLRQLGKPWAPGPSPEMARIADVEKRYLAQGRSRILIGVPTQVKAENGLPCLNGLSTPVGAEVKLFNCHGNPVDDAYNFIVSEALNDGADMIITVEDDTFPPPDAIVRLVDLVRGELRKGNKVAAGAWYPKREEPRQGVHIVVNGTDERGPLKDDGEVHEVYTLAMGCSVYPIQMFNEVKFPWFKTTGQLSQDSFFSQLARDAGWKLLVDTSIKCKHIDRTTGKVYE